MATRIRKYRTPTYISWEGMKYRCYTKSNPSYSNYGGRGISVCDRWKSFENFLIDMGEKPYGTSLDRINSNENYSPENCRWANVEIQQNNRSNNNRQIVDGILMGVSQCSRIYNISRSTIASRMLRNGMTLQEAKDA